MTEPGKKTFEEMAKIDVSSKVEKKGKFSYLSWPYAVSEFRKNCPYGTWATIKHNGSPVLTTEQGHFVEVEVTPDTNTPEIKFAQIHPILDGANKPVTQPTAFQVNTSIQRCLVKAIAIATGIGLFIYAGEDLPESETKPDEKKDLSTKDALRDQAANEYAAELCAGIDTCTTMEKLVAWRKANADKVNALAPVHKAKVSNYWLEIEKLIKENDMPV